MCLTYLNLIGFVSCQDIKTKNQKFNLKTIQLLQNYRLYS